MAENQISSYLMANLRNTENAENTSKELNLSCFTYLKTSELSLTVGGILQSLWPRELSQSGCQVLNMREPGLSCPCCEDLIELYTLL